MINQRVVRENLMPEEKLLTKKIREEKGSSGSSLPKLTPTEATTQEIIENQ